MNVDPVRDALLADARRDADDLRAAAERDAAAAVQSARDEAQGMLAAARAEGAAEARTVAAAELARARRHARELVLAARRDAYERARTETSRAASELRHAPGYTSLVEGLIEVAGRQLGEAAVTSVDDTAGGIVASAGSRTVDYRLPAIADRCLAARGTELESLWR